MKKKILLFTGLFALLFFTGLFTFQKLGAPQEEKSPEALPSEVIIEKVTLSIDYGDNQVDSFEKDYSEDETAFGLLKYFADQADVEIITKQYDFGVFVEAINGFESGSEMAWIYFVNGESGTVAADQYQLSAGDVVEWKYQQLAIDN